MSNIIVSPNDRRKYKYIKLSNEVECVIISDPETEKSAASCVMGAGSLNNPQDRPGVAHFIEHMQKLGTEKYPSSTEVLNYVKTNSGTRNATTYFIETAYFFDIANPALEKALDMLAQFFICPLFNESHIESEMNVIDEEYRKDLLFDDRRDRMLMRMTSKQGHPLNSFPTGNIETLKVPSIRQDMLDFYNKYYSANLLKVCILGKENLEDLEKLVTKLFSEVKNKNVKQLEVKEPPFDEGDLKKLFKSVPIAEKDILRFEWYLGNVRPYYKDNPFNYIKSIILDKGKSSLINYLKDENLALELDFGHLIIAEFMTKINLDINLTKKGLSETQKVIRIVFEFFKMLRETEVNKDLWDEYKQILRIKFEYKDKENPRQLVHAISMKMFYIPPEDLLQEGYLMETFNPDQIKNIIKELDINNLRIYLSSKSFEPACTKTEKWYSIKYIDEPFSDELINFYYKPQIDKSSSGFQLGLPSLSKFIPKNFKVNRDAISENPSKPKEVFSTDLIRLSFKEDDLFLQPKAEARLLLKCNDNDFGSTTKSGAFLRIWKRLFENSLDELKLEASNAAFSIITTISKVGLEIKFSGFNDTMKSFIDEYFQKLVSFEFTDKETLFNDLKADMIKKTQNLFIQKPWEIAKEFEELIQVVTPLNVHPDEIIKNYKLVTFQDLVLFNKSWLNTIKIEALIIGNMMKEEAISIAQSIESILKQKKDLKPLCENLVPEARVVELPLNEARFYEVKLQTTKSGDKEQNSCCLCIFQHEEATIQSEVLMEVLLTFIHEPCFNTLRTKELLGYIVRNYPKIYNGIISFSILVQSSKKAPQYVSSRILAFLDTMREKVNLMTDEEFIKYQESARVSISQKDLTITQESSRYWSQIIDHSFDFTKKEKSLDYLKELKKQEFISFFENLFYKARRLLEIHVISVDHAEENEKLKFERIKNEKNIKEAKSIEWLKRYSNLYPDYYLSK